ncbi:hypothetical protein D3C73_1109930 [compost metagenome]
MTQLVRFHVRVRFNAEVHTSNGAVVFVRVAFVDGVNEWQVRQTILEVHVHCFFQQVASIRVFCYDFQLTIFVCFYAQQVTTSELFTVHISQAEAHNLIYFVWIKREPRIFCFAAAHELVRARHLWEDVECTFT